ncbi:V-type ATP synthase subunit E [Intestinimonas massiliensis (ex Afouda et al. 2020)]|uniref:V-type ATP synthase subunit E n=1 Tax=Intestinimonas massiliensis (ex Afouda et al. 2020) TaxID=1673721 RepID=UPI001030E728|nr:V-type ATP synthase subunit E family protein [Intestinimonas massiliensis (ex Afouda et al. 2020)]
MPDMTEKLDRFTAKILAEASEETRRAMDQAEHQRDNALRKAEDQVLREAYRYIHGEVARIKAEAGRSVSRRMLENQRALSLRREEMAKETFALVRARIAAFTRTEAYGKRLEELLTDALGRLPGAEDVQICLREEDKGWIPALTRAAGGRKLDFRSGEFRMGGLVALSPSLGLRVDSSFDSAAQELSGHFAELFGLSLSDE